MANYTASARSNYFKVKDIEAFRALIDTMPDMTLCAGEDGTEHAGKVMVHMGDDDCGAWPTQRWIGANLDEEEEIDMAQEIAPHLAEGEVAVFLQVGNEKLRYVGGHAFAVNGAGKTVELGLHQIFEMAEALGPNVDRTGG